MSRSRKRNPIIKQRARNVKAWKRFASKAARRHDDISDGAMYKRLYDSYNICDYRSILWRSYFHDGRPKRPWYAYLSEKIEREYWNK